MPELRQNYVTKEWVIIASERAKRPSAFAEPAGRPSLADLPTHDPKCPFCVGNEEDDLHVESWPTREHWQTRVVQNKFPALAGPGEPAYSADGIQHRLTAVGYHEVLIDHRTHNTTLALMQPPEVQAVFLALQRRSRAMAQDQRIKQVILFKNHGPRAGSSLVHPHCQIIGLPVVPDSIQRRLTEMERHYAQTGECSLCALLQDELDREERLVAVSEHFVAFVLFAALSPFHMWIVPRQHRTCFEDVPEHEIADLGHVVQDVIYRMHIGLNNPDYNLIIRSAPAQEAQNVHFHWYITLVPRLSVMAGFEMGSGMHINPSLPEQGAAFLRDVAVPQT